MYTILGTGTVYYLGTVRTFSVFLTEEDETRAEAKGPEEISEPEEVRLARDDLLSLTKEKDLTERMKRHKLKELENAKVKAAHIEGKLPHQVNSEDQREILGLLCKVHELEIENMEMRSTCLLRTFELRKREMIIAKYEQHHSLCDEIITQQRGFMENSKVSYHKELEDLYEVYQHDTEEMYVDRQCTLPEIHSYKVLYNRVRCV